MRRRGPVEDQCISMSSQFENHFELFGLKVRFALDQAALDSAYREIQARVHPDRFAAAGETERRLSIQWATRVNEAYRVLRQPLERAAYMLQLAGIDPKFETDTAMPQEFLLRQMELREALEEASRRSAPATLDRLRVQIRNEMRGAESELGKRLDVEGDYAAAVPAVRALMFLDKLDAEVSQAFEALDA